MPHVHKLVIKQEIEEFEIEAFRDNDLVFRVQLANVLDPSAYTFKMHMMQTIDDAAEISGWPITGSWNASANAFDHTVADTATATLSGDYAACFRRDDAGNEVDVALGTIKWRKVPVI